MSRAANSPGGGDYALRAAPSVLTDAACLAPRPASEAVGRAVGVDRTSLVPADPRRKAVGVGILVAVVAAASLPLATAMLTQLL